MLAFAIRRVLISIPILIVSTFIVFLIVSLSGDPLVESEDQAARAPEPTIKLAEHRLRLDQPLLERYWHWITGVFHGDFGPSVAGRTLDIGTEIGHRCLVTLRLVSSPCWWLRCSPIVVGVISATKQYSNDRLHVHLHRLPVPGDADVLVRDPAEGRRDLVERALRHEVQHHRREFAQHRRRGPGRASSTTFDHLILPTITLALISYASWSRFNRASMLEVLSSDYVRLARAKGSAPGPVLIRHALRTALIPLVTVTALDIGAILGGAIITENVFQWRGMGDFLLPTALSLTIPMSCWRGCWSRRPPSSCST